MWGYKVTTYKGSVEGAEHICKQMHSLILEGSRLLVLKGWGNKVRTGWKGLGWKLIKKGWGNRMVRKEVR